jgi:hypothetical protein
VTQLKERAGFPLKKSLAVLNLPARTYHRWTSLSGKKPHPEGVVPNGHWILPEEREKIVAFKRQNCQEEKMMSDFQDFICPLFPERLCPGSP